MYIPTIDLSLMLESIPFLLSGLGYTIGISLAAFFFGNLLGILMTILGFVPFRIVKLFVLKFQVQVSHLLKFIGYLVFVGYLAAKDSSDSSFNKHSRGVA
ncbi:hypothetical protein ACR77M_16225, partial [Enterococcus avium]